MEEIEFPLFLSSYFYTYVLCQSIFALGDIILNSLTLSSHLIPLPTLPSCFLFTVNIVDQTSNPFIWNCLRKYPFFHWTSLWYLFMWVWVCVCTIYACISLAYSCVYVYVSLHMLCACYLLSLWNHQHFHRTVQWLRNMLVLTSFWYSKSTAIPACLNCLSLSHRASKLKEEQLERKQMKTGWMSPAT